MKHYKTQGGIIIMYSSLNIVVAISKANPFSTGRYDGTGTRYARLQNILTFRTFDNVI